jgi:HK97 gp10 family phage protein
LAGISMRVDGLKELDASLGNLTKATARGVLKRTLVDASKPLVASAASKAPRDTGVLAGSIAASAKINNTAGKAEFSAVMRSGGSRGEAVQALRDARRAAKDSASFAEIFVGPAVRPKSEPKNRVLEFGGGRGNRAPQPFMRPAWDETKGAVLDGIKDALAAQIAKAAARAARRAARLK